jgi:glycerol-3-phosphate dehydrogenase (NAD(P)+)
VSEQQKIAVIGGGAFGSALACVAARAGHDVMLYLRDNATAKTINQNHRNLASLGDISMPNEVRATSNPLDLKTASIVLFAVPAQQTRAAAKTVAPFVITASSIIACAKGLEQQSGAFQHQILSEVFPGQTILALSGPSFAADIARKLPTALTIASHHIKDAERMAEVLFIPSFRLYASNDLIGVEIGGALKNVLAIAVGAARGMALGASAEAALIARGFAELQRLGQGMGAREETLTGLSGLGDLVLTCSSPQSRNFSYGMALGRGDDLDNLPLAEGVHSAKTAARIAAEYCIEAPIISTIARVLAGELSPKEAVEALLARPLRSETG